MVWMQEPLITIGEVAARAGVATSTVRYYERRGLLAADARRVRSAPLHTGVAAPARVHRHAAGRRTALDEIDGVLNADTVAEWKAIAARRLDVLDERSRSCNTPGDLAGALLCRYDHPATDCRSWAPRSTAASRQPSSCARRS